MKYCTNCGNAVPDNAVHCPHCGQSLPGKRTPKALYILIGSALFVGIILLSSLLLRQRIHQESGNTDNDVEPFPIATQANTISPTIIGVQIQESPLPAGRLVFMSDRDGDFEIYIMNIDGSNLIKLTDNSVDDYVPVWSPDGKKRILF